MTPAVRCEVLSASALRASLDPRPAATAGAGVEMIKSCRQDRTAQVARDSGGRPDTAVAWTRRAGGATAPPRA
ncbi:hypothetical protein [Catellatospora chokoriensis]|uniref:Uncharacterized protein n=1 Tax=Catellatospora chokoriensis TaxID=310353 RepID=A0A8J3NRE6_9ACTN|nr:hypothetical protein [Catellatospora chokoriensis]GIF89456.1 hypothetical protein Cch02nite_29000 [Catellatospora chokoriensis]